MDPSTVQQQSIFGNEVALNSNSTGQAINVPNGHDASEERIPSPAVRAMSKAAQRFRTALSSLPYDARGSAGSRGGKSGVECHGS